MKYLHLKQKGTGFIYMHTPILAKRDDMELYTPEEEVERPDKEKLQVQVDATDPASTKDWRKITKKSDLAAYAKSNDGIELDQERTLQNMRAQYISAIQAREQGNDPQTAVAAQADHAE